MADDVKDRQAQRNKDLRARYEQLVPRAQEIDGLTALHVYRMRSLFGRSFEWKAILIWVASGFLMVMILDSFMRPVLGYMGGMMAGVIGLWLGWKLSGRFLLGDGAKVKAPHQRKEQRDLIANTVASGVVEAPGNRYEFIVAGEPSDFREYLIQAKRGH